MWAAQIVWNHISIILNFLDFSGSEEAPAPKKKKKKKKKARPKEEQEKREYKDNQKMSFYGGVFCIWFFGGKQINFSHHFLCAMNERFLCPAHVLGKSTHSVPLLTSRLTPQKSKSQKIFIWRRWESEGGGLFLNLSESR